MKPGDVVTVFRDPVTELDEEGRAILVQFLHSDAPYSDQEYWRVRFAGEAVTYRRWIRNPKIELLPLPTEEEALE